MVSANSAMQDEIISRVVTKMTRKLGVFVGYKAAMKKGKLPKSGVSLSFAFVVTV